VEKLRVILPFEFENRAVIALGGIPNKVQVGDMGVEGRFALIRLRHGSQRRPEIHGSNFGCTLRCEFFSHSFSQSASDGTVTSACFEQA
jgi:hypothetical protein